MEAKGVAAPSAKQDGEEEKDEEEEEDDYMNINFEDPKSSKESSIARAQRLKKESLARGIVKSKAQLKEEEEIARETALSKSMLDDASVKKSKAFAMMTKMGYRGGGLGRKDEEGKVEGRTEPIRIQTKEDRGGIGLDSERKRKMREAAEENGGGVKAAKLDPDEYRERVRKEREDAKLEKQFYATQRMAERLDDEKMTGDNQTSDDDVAAVKKKKKIKKGQPLPMASRPLKSIPVLYRGLIRHREEEERGRRMRHDLEQSLSRLPTYEDEEEDEDDKKALGKKKDSRMLDYAVAEDLDEEDEELEAFNELQVGERLRRVLEYLRKEHWYCFWCKEMYDGENMEGCPGVEEEDHD